MFLSTFTVVRTFMIPGRVRADEVRKEMTNDDTTCPRCGSNDTEERENLGKTHQHCNSCSYGWSA
ncbi:hypothetical protein DNAM5_21 [Haloarcula californiae tailed virus 1]|uniref:Uncharacterized protein n=1 Tax=Haloarcula californiae tailed virus 1 TaxID=1273746 RepID=R4T801_9CAUD|nr:hypothetical protein M202_gp021 [Haloarcula californiae tailed virus 1]AGM11884.1 hypothetical protein DNAM5_21 [Haloarcula californiae tailed virus 1]